MIKIAVCDGNLKELDLVCAKLRKYFAQHSHLEAKLSIFKESSVFLDSFQKENFFDLYIVDIMHCKNFDLDFAKQLRQKYKNSKLIFITHSQVHAIDAFMLNASHYLLKPLVMEDFKEALDRVIWDIERSKKSSFNLHCVSGFHHIKFKDIIFIETQQNYQCIHTKEGQTLKIRMSSKQLFEKLEHDARFYKYGASFILNLDKILKVDKEEVLLNNLESLQMQRRHYKPLAERYEKINADKILG